MTKSFEARHDVVGGFGPYEWLGFGVVSIEVVANGGLQLTRGSMGPTTDLALCEGGEPALHLIEPGRRGWGEMNMESRMTSEPVADRGCLVRPVVIHHQVDIQIGRHARLNGAKEFQELDTAVAAMKFSDDLPRGDVQSREQGCGAVAHVVVGTPLRNSGRQGQDGLCAIQ